MTLDCTPRTKLMRRFPDNRCVLQLLGAMLWRAGLDRFRALRMPSEAILDPVARMVADVLLAEREFTEDELAMIWIDDEQTMSWGDGIAIFVPDTAEAAVRCVDRFAYEYAQFWFPATLEWVARCTRADRWSFAQAADEIDRVLALARPRLLRLDGVS